MAAFAERTFVLVADTCFRSSVWRPLRQELEGDGATVVTVDLPVPYLEVTDVDDYNQPLVDALTDLPDGGAVVVAHGMGGINAALAVDALPEKVAVAVFVNAFLPDDQHYPGYVIDEFMTVFKDKDWEDTQFSVRSSSDGTKLMTTKTLGSRFLRERVYPLRPVEDLEIRIGSYFQESLAQKYPSPLSKYGSVAKVYVGSVRDAAMPYAFQQWQLENYPLQDAHAVGGNADHLMMVSAPGSLAKILHKYND